jgi:hypothetical protein
MKLIAHRGNICGPNEELENSPKQILNTLSLGYDCEIDVHLVNNELYLGHDEPKYKIDINFLLSNKDNLWIHCKNIEALNFLIDFNELNIFWHNKDEYTITSKKYIWSYIGMKTTNKIICVMPELRDPNNVNYFFGDIECYAICTDYCLINNNN